MLLAPFYINLLNIYAFSNLHDFSCVSRALAKSQRRLLTRLHRSWGTKEQTTHEVDLGVAASAGKDVVDILLVSLARSFSSECVADPSSSPLSKPTSVRRAHLIHIPQRTDFRSQMAPMLRLCACSGRDR